MRAPKTLASADKLRSYFINERLLHFKKGEVLARPAQPPAGVYFIEKGFVKVYTISDSGNEYVHIIYKAGEVFPLIWALKSITRNVFYEALAPTRVRVMPKSDFLELIETDHDACRLFLDKVTEQFGILADRLDNLEYSHARERVIYRLLFLAGRFGEKIEDGILINAPVTQQLLASTINLQRETVSREVESLEAARLISYANHKIVIRNLKKLTKMISEPVSPSLWGMK